MHVDLARFCSDFDVAIVVLSRDRADTLAKYTDSILSGYHLFYSGEGYDERPYRAAEMVEVPRGVQGLSAVRNYVLNTLPHRIVLFFDDDIKAIYWTSGVKSVRLDREGVALAAMNLVVHALDQKSIAFGMSAVDIRKASPLTPFRLRAVFGTVLGVVGREVQFDERNLLKTDYDFCLETMKSARIVHLDMRYYVLSAKDDLPGGNMSFRTQERRHREIDNLIRWWGDDVIIPKANKGNDKLQVIVP